MCPWDLKASRVLLRRALLGGLASGHCTVGAGLWRGPVGLLWPLAQMEPELGHSIQGPRGEWAWPADGWTDRKESQVAMVEHGSQRALAGGVSWAVGWFVQGIEGWGGCDSGPPQPQRLGRDICPPPSLCGETAVQSVSLDSCSGRAQAGTWRLETPSLWRWKSCPAEGPAAGLPRLLEEGSHHRGRLARLLGRVRRKAAPGDSSPRGHRPRLHLQGERNVPFLQWR